MHFTKNYSQNLSKSSCVAICAYLQSSFLLSAYISLIRPIDNSSKSAIDKPNCTHRRRNNSMCTSSPLPELPPDADVQLSLTLYGSFTVPGCSRIPPGVAPLAKNFAPYSSQAMVMPIAFFAIAIGEYPTNPSNPRPGM